MAPWQPVLDGWFGSHPSLDEMLAAQYVLWFGEDDALDDQARQRFAGLTDQARQGLLNDWALSPQGWLALVLLLDQMPRSLYRGTAQAYASDAEALQCVRDGLTQGGDMLLPAIQRVFLYITLAHAENLALQEESVRHFSALQELALPLERPFYTGLLKCAIWHREVISRFGRFPGRNALLGRTSTAEEQAYMREFTGRSVELSGAFSL